MTPYDKLATSFSGEREASELSSLVTAFFNIPLEDRVMLSVTHRNDLTIVECVWLQEDAQVLYRRRWICRQAVTLEGSKPSASGQPTE